MRADIRSIRFVRALLPDRTAQRDADHYEVVRTDRIASLPLAEVEALAALGVLVAGGGLCRLGPRVQAWLTAQQPSSAKQDTGLSPGVMIDLNESPLARLASGKDAFLAPHHVEAGERVRRLVERARLTQRVTMSYDANRVGRSSSGQGGAPDVADSALDARTKLAKIAAVLPTECAGVVLDVCGLLKGLQTVELERRWPRRSAKLVLRIGLEQLARYFGLTETATGRGAQTQSWVEQRLPLIGD